MPRLKDITKRIPFKYSTYQIRRFNKSKELFIVSFYDSTKLNAEIGIIHQSGKLEIFLPYEGLDLPDNDLIEVGNGFVDTFNTMYNYLDETGRNILNKEVSLIKFKGNYFIEYDKDSEHRTLLNPDGYFYKSEFNNRETFIRKDSLFNVLNSSEINNYNSTLGCFY